MSAVWPGVSSTARHTAAAASNHSTVTCCGVSGVAGGASRIPTETMKLSVMSVSSVLWNRASTASGAPPGVNCPVAGASSTYGATGSAAWAGAAENNGSTRNAAQLSRVVKNALRRTTTSSPRRAPPARFLA
ncbi:hypothetical protein B6E66_18045 [Streptomyces maremycinicus]|nr:hypothetical protein B6E66_18045 [Streptomyces sp. B9173]